MKLWVGARELGLDVQWQYAFVGMGATVPPIPDAIVVDVGNRLGPGVIDQPLDASYPTGSAALVVQHPDYVYNHLMGPWLELARRGVDLRGRTWRPRVVTHHNPDFDGVVAALIVQRLVEFGDIPAWARALASYAARDDQGRFGVDFAEDSSWRQALHCYFHMLLEGPGHPTEDAEKMHLGRDFLLRVVRHLPSNLAPDELEPGAGALTFLDASSDDSLCDSSEALSDRQFFGRIRQNLEEDIARFVEHDLLSPLNVVKGVRVPMGHQGALGHHEVCAVILPRRPASVLFDYWVSAKSIETLLKDQPTQIAEFPERIGMYIYEVEGTASGPGRRWIFIGLGRGDAVPPDASLFGLGYALEREETRKRRSPGGPGDARIREPRYPDGYCDNADPWYDGRAHQYRLVDSPRSGTVLSFEEVKQIAIGTPYWQIPIARGYLVELRFKSETEQGAPEGAEANDASGSDRGPPRKKRPREAPGPNHRGADFDEDEVYAAFTEPTRTFLRDVDGPPLTQLFAERAGGGGRPTGDAAAQTDASTSESARARSTGPGSRPEPTETVDLRLPTVASSTMVSRAGTLGRRKSGEVARSCCELKAYRWASQGPGTELDPPAPSTLEQLHTTIKAWRQESPDVIVVGALELGPSMHDEDSIRRVLAQIAPAGGIDPDIGGEILEDSHTHILWVPPDHQRVDEPESRDGGRSRVLKRWVIERVAMHLYAGFLQRELEAFSSSISAPGNVVRDVREKFLELQSKYFHHLFANDSELQAEFHRLSERIGLQEAYQEVNEQLDRLHEVEAQKSARIIEGLLFALALVGIAEPVFSVPKNLRSWVGASAFRVAAVVFGVVLAIVGFGIGCYRFRREIGAGLRRIRAWFRRPFKRTRPAVGSDRQVAGPGQANGRATTSRG